MYACVCTFERERGQTQSYCDALLQGISYAKGEERI